MAPPCGDLLPILLTPANFEGKIFGEVSTVAKWRWGGIGEERLMGCLRRLRVRMCKLCSMMMILGPTAPSIIVQRCIQPRSRKDKRFLMNLIALAKVLTILMSISIKLTRKNENMCACLCTVFRPVLAFAKRACTHLGFKDLGTLLCLRLSEKWLLQIQDKEM